MLQVDHLRMSMSAPQRRRAETPKRPGRVRKAERKRQLLEHAKALFIADGYQNTTTAKIALAAGIGEPMLCSLFETKEALFLEVLQEIREATVNRWRDGTSDAADPLARLHTIAEMYLDATRAQARELRIMHRTLVETEDKEIASHLRTFYLDCEQLLTEIIREGQQTGVFRRSLDPRVGAWELIRTALGYTLTLPLGIPLDAEPDYVPKAVDCLLYCLLKTDV